MSQCPNCVADQSMFTCKKNGLEVCLKKSQYQCNGYPYCDGYSNTLSSQCDDCAADHLFKCKYNGVDVCLNSKFKCDGVRSCDDYDDEVLSE